MRTGDLSNLPNPFAPTSPRKWDLRRLSSPLKSLTLIVVALAGLLAVTSRGPSWMAGRIGDEFGSLSSDKKIARLSQLSKLGVDGLEPMMAGIADPDPQVAQTAMQLIRDSQRDWTTLTRSRSNENELALVRAIEKSIGEFSSDQQAWAAELLNQSIIGNADATTDVERQIFASANRGLTKIGPVHAPGNRKSEPQSPATLRLVDSGSVSLNRPPSQSPPLPLGADGDDPSWTDWPPQRPTIVQAGFLDETSNTDTIKMQPQVGHDSDSDHQTVNDDSHTAAIPVAQANLSLPVFATNESSPKPLEDQINSPNATTYQVSESTESVVETQLGDMDTGSIVQFLDSDHRDIRQQAQQRLKQRGFSDMELTVASAIATSQPAYRIELIRQLAEQQTVDARPWLLMLLKDTDQKVKLTAIGALEPMLDSSIRNELQQRLVDERDQKVLLRIRRVLGLSCTNE